MEKQKERIAKFIKDVRKQKQLTQSRFAQLIWPDDDLHLATCRIANYESARVCPPGDVLITIQDLDKEVN